MADCGRAAVGGDKLVARVVDKVMVAVAAGELELAGAPGRDRRAPDPRCRRSSLTQRSGAACARRCRPRSGRPRSARTRRRRSRVSRWTGRWRACRGRAPDPGAPGAPTSRRRRRARRATSMIRCAHLLPEQSPFHAPVREIHGPCAAARWPVPGSGAASRPPQLPFMISAAGMAGARGPA